MTLCQRVHRICSCPQTGGIDRFKFKHPIWHSFWWFPSVFCIWYQLPTTQDIKQARLISRGARSAQLGYEFLLWYRGTDYLLLRQCAAGKAIHGMILWADHMYYKNLLSLPPTSRSYRLRDVCVSNCRVAGAWGFNHLWPRPRRMTHFLSHRPPHLQNTPLVPPRQLVSLPPAPLLQPHISRHHQDFNGGWVHFH